MLILDSLVESGELRALPSFNFSLSYEEGWSDKFLTIERWEGEENETAHAYDACVVSNMLAKFLIQDLASMQPAQQASYFWGACCAFYFQNVSKQSYLYVIVYLTVYVSVFILALPNIVAALKARAVSHGIF